MSDSQLGRLPPIAGDTRPEYRLVVAATKQSPKGFGWAIVRDDDNAHVPLRQSIQPFRSMAEAHDAGVVALREFRSEQR